jgi:hypothetical protein
MHSSPSRGYSISPDGQGFVSLAFLYGGEAVKYSDIPKNLIDGVEVFAKQSLILFESWLKEDTARILSPELRRMLKGQTVTKINIIQNWFEELKLLVPTNK